MRMGKTKILLVVMALVLLTGCKSNKNQIESPSPINKLDEDEIGKDIVILFLVEIPLKKDTKP